MIRSCLFVRNHLDLTSALDINPSYLRNNYSESGAVTDYRNWQIPLGRRFRSLKIWFVMRTYGIDGMQAFVRNGMHVGSIFTKLIRGRSDLFEIITKPAFGLTVFRVKEDVAADALNLRAKPDIDAGREYGFHASNMLTRRVEQAINASGEIFLTSSTVAGMVVIRIVSANERAQEDYIKRAFEIIISTTENILAEKQILSEDKN